MKSYNIIFVGSEKVGKTALAVRYTREQFVGEHFMPTNIDYSKVILMNGQSCTFHFLDVGTTKEQPDFNRITLTHGLGFVLVYSITDQPSFDDLPKLREEILRCKDMHDVPTVLVGNKSDQDDERMVSEEQGISLAHSFNSCAFYESSAKDNINVNELFEDLLEQIYKKFPPPKKKKIPTNCTLL